MGTNATRDLYYWIIDHVLSMRDGGGHFEQVSEGRNLPQGTDHTDYNDLWARLRSARLFSVPTVLLNDTYEEVGGYLKSLVRLGKPDELPVEEGTDLLMRTGTHHAFPEHLSFDHVLLLYPWGEHIQDGSKIDQHTSKIAPVVGAGLYLSDEELGWRVGPEVVPRLRQQGLWSVLGHLVSHDGKVWELLRWAVLQVNGKTLPIDYTSGTLLESIADLPKGLPVQIATGFATLVMRDGLQWFCPLSMNPWALTAMTSMINDYKTLVIQKPTLKDRTQAKRWSKKRGLKRFSPPMYYGVMLRDNVVFTSSVEDQFEEGVRRCYADFRSDVRGHERCRIRRGPIPMDLGKRQKLLGRGYKLYEHVMDLEAGDEKRLRERGTPFKQRGEWLAIKTTWVDAYIKGPEDAPYIPASRHLPIQPPATWG